MPSLRRIFVAASAVLALAGPPASAASASQVACDGADEAPQPETLARARAATVCLINAERAARGIRALTENPEMARASERYSRRMVRRRFFDHVGPHGDTVVERLRAVGYLHLDPSARWAVGENLAWGRRASGTPRQIVRAWMQSPGHRRNILSRRYHEVGLGIALGSPVQGGSDPAATYTTAFGTVRRTR
jgi:uncharacterized protein YkwD